MSNSSEIDNKQKRNEQFLKIPLPISQQLKEFVEGKHYLFDYYSRHKYLKKPSPLELFGRSIIDFFWKSNFQKILTFIILFCFSILLIETFNKSINDVFIAIIFLVSWVLLYIKTIIYLIPSYKEIKKDIKNYTKWIDLAEEYDPRSHRKFIKNLGENNSVRELKIEEQRFRIVIISQTRAKDLADSAIPLISFLFAIFGLYIFGIPQNWGNSLEIATFAGIGIVPLITVIFSFLTKLSSENLLIYQHCLFILQEALIIAEEREKVQKNILVENINEKYESILQELQNITKEIKKDKKPSSINKNIQGKYLFKKLKKIKIDDKNIDATEELLNISGFESAMRRANQQVKEGKVRDWREIRDDV